MFKKILIPTDGSELSNQAANAGVVLAHSVGAEVVALYVTQPMDVYTSIEGMSGAYAEYYEKTVAEKADEYLKRVSDRAQTADVKVTTRTVRSFNAAEGIVQVAADEHCDLIFIGSHGRSGLSRLLLGSVAAKVLSLSSISTLVFQVKH